MLGYWLRFSAVGLAGAALQLAVLALLVRVSGLEYLAATALAVEAALLHNFAWHEKWTWRDRQALALGVRCARLWKFHATNGLTSIAGNVLVMRVLAGGLGMPVLPANAVAIIACSSVNFLLSHVWVFRLIRKTEARDGGGGAFF